VRSKINSSLVKFVIHRPQVLGVALDRFTQPFGREFFSHPLKRFVVIMAADPYLGASVVTTNMYAIGSAFQTRAKQRKSLENLTRHGATESGSI
jgi:hypothetical protein